MIIDILFFCIHWMIPLFSSFYVFFFSKEYDVYYLTFLTVIFMHWYFMKGECIITYIYKKIKNPKYILGSDPTDIKDMKTDNIIIYGVFMILNLLTCICMIIVFYRNNDRIPLYISFTTIILLLIYIDILRRNVKRYIPFVGFMLSISAGITYMCYMLDITHIL